MKAKKAIYRFVFAGGGGRNISQRFKPNQEGPYLLGLIKPGLGSCCESFKTPAGASYWGYGSSASRAKFLIRARKRFRRATSFLRSLSPASPGGRCLLMISTERLCRLIKLKGFFFLFLPVAAASSNHKKKEKKFPWHFF